VAHACNPSYRKLGGREQEDPGSKPAWENSSGYPILKKTIIHTKKSGRVAQGVGLEFKSQYHKKKIQMQMTK
jgi:hypothetical protein